LRLNIKLNGRVQQTETFSLAPAVEEKKDDGAEAA